MKNEIEEGSDGGRENKAVKIRSAFNAVAEFAVMVVVLYFTRYMHACYYYIPFE